MNMRTGETPTAKVVMLGDSNQGKSAIILKFITGNFIEEHDPTIEDLYQAYHVTKEEPIILEILDTSGANEYQQTFGDQWIRESDVFVLIYSIDSDLQSHSNIITPFDQCTTWRENIFKIKETSNELNIPIILVANKCDISENDRKIPYHIGKQLADDWHCPYIEVSAKNDQNLDALWDTIVIQYRKSQRQELKYQMSDNSSDINEQKYNINNKSFCHCNCLKTVENDSSPLALEKIQISKSDTFAYVKETRIPDNIKLYNVNKLPIDDIFEPIISATNFEIKRRFDIYKFMKMILCGVFLPIIVFIQTMIFWFYLEKSSGETSKKCIYKFYPYNYKYNDIHYWIFLDFLGLIVGREPNQDPETTKNRKWFLRQTNKQLWIRMLVMAIIVVMFCILWYNVCQSNNNELIGVSNMETFGVFILYWVIWILLSLWVGNKTIVLPELPLLSKLRSIDLYFGKDLNVNNINNIRMTSAYKIIRGYLYSENKDEKIALIIRIYIFIVALFYALIPGITRSIVHINDLDGNPHNNSFFTENSHIVQIGALLINFVLVSVLMYIIECQYTKHFNNYKKWMKNLTMILNEYKPNNKENNDDFFGCNLFLSLIRKSNALGWLEIRSFLSVKGGMFFGEQELPILWILLITVALTAFIVYRVYFIPGHALASIVFNGVLFLTFVCLIALTRIASNSFKFQSLQSIQEKFIGQQKFFMKCRSRKNNNNNNNIVLEEEEHSQNTQITVSIDDSDFQQYNN
eukprot:483914_1